MVASEPRSGDVMPPAFGEFMTSATATQPEDILELEAGDSNAAQGDAQVFKKYSQMKLQMKRDAPWRSVTAEPAKWLRPLRNRCALESALE
jgi:hypothetical protein